MYPLKTANFHFHLSSLNNGKYKLENSKIEASFSLDVQWRSDVTHKYSSFSLSRVELQSLTLSLWALLRIERCLGYGSTRTLHAVAILYSIVYAVSFVLLLRRWRRRRWMGWQHNITHVDSRGTQTKFAFNGLSIWTRYMPLLCCQLLLQPPLYIIYYIYKVYIWD